jgi:hypothetical protein
LPLSILRVNPEQTPDFRPEKNEEKNEGVDFVHKNIK